MNPTFDRRSLMTTGGWLSADSGGKCVPLSKSPSFSDHESTHVAVNECGHVQPQRVVYRRTGVMDRERLDNQRVDVHRLTPLGVEFVADRPVADVGDRVPRGR